MLTRFCQENRLVIADYYIDDGFSGLSFERPAFLRLMDDIESGQIDLIITKDLSRLGRDYIMTGYLTDIYFSRMSVRYIAIDDGIDTQRDSNDIAPFKNIMNDMYAKDISRKIKSAKRQRAYRGMYISAQVPYGYKVDPLDHNHLIVDTVAAEVMKTIFSQALEGKTLSAIARSLTNSKITSPSVYKAQQGDSRYASYLNKSIDAQTTWNTSTLAKLLHDPVYIGHMVNHKYEVINYKTKERRCVPKKEQIIVENTHEAIISKNTFDRVQEILGSRAHVHRHNFDNWLQGKVYCADCQRPMTLMIKVQKRGHRAIFRCIHSYKFPEACTGYRAIAYDKLLCIVYDTIVMENSIGVSELNRTLIRQQVNRILVSKRQEDRNQDVKIVLNDQHKRKRKFGLTWLE